MFFETRWEGRRGEKVGAKPGKATWPIIHGLPWDLFNERGVRISRVIATLGSFYIRVCIKNGVEIVWTFAIIKLNSLDCDVMYTSENKFGEFTMHWKGEWPIERAYAGIMGLKGFILEIFPDHKWHANDRTGKCQKLLCFLFPPSLFILLVPSRKMLQVQH